MDWTLTFKSNVYQDIAYLDKKNKKLFAQAQELLMTVPNIDDGKLIKKLQGFKNFWRLKMNHYRLIYEINDKDKTVRCLMMGSKNSVYSRFGYNENGPTPEVIANEDLADLLEFKPSDEDRGRAIIESSIQEKELEMAFPKTITDQELEDLDIANKFHSQIKSCSCEEDLQLLEKNGVDVNSIEKILNFYFPPKLAKVINNPSRVSLSSDDFEKISNKSKKLEDFLLELDEVQKPFVNRFSGKAPQGPWLVKGGPGSGKSTVAIYCVKELLSSLNEGLDIFPNSNLNILFTTYNRSLIGASIILLRELGFREGNTKLTTTNIDDISKNYASTRLKQMQLINFNNKWRPYLIEAIQKDFSNTFSTSEADFIFDEIRRCIISEDLKNIDNYLGYDRSGRGRRLGVNQKKAIWAIYLEFETILKNNNMSTLEHRHKDAVINAEPIFDYVFIDEAQDFTPVQIKLCNKLVKNGNIFLTADANQSIYGSQFSWKRAADGLDFRGKTTNLKTNYRTTLEIWNAVLPVLDNIPDQDSETLDFVPFRHGEIPSMLSANNNESPKKISTWILETALDEKLPYSCAAILCPTNIIGEKITLGLDSKLNAKFMDSKNVDIQWPGVKVMTMHSAKGLQFPIVVVASVNHGIVPFEVHGGESQSEKDNSTRKLLFVACTRAMNRLLLVKDPYKPSRLLSELPISEWEEID